MRAGFCASFRACFGNFLSVQSEWSAILRQLGAIKIAAFEIHVARKRLLDPCAESDRKRSAVRVASFQEVCPSSRKLRMQTPDAVRIVLRISDQQLSAFGDLFEQYQL